jgi:hypothetical protein
MLRNRLKGESPSFLKKRSKRLLLFRSRIERGHGRRVGGAPEIKVFWFFSSEKNILSKLDAEASRFNVPKTTWAEARSSSAACEGPFRSRINEVLR